MIKVVLRLSRTNLRRWHGFLASGLSEAGYDVAIVWAGPSSAPCPFDTLRAIEKRIFHVEPASAGARMTELPGSFPVASDSTSAAIVLDCTGAPIGRDAPMLLPDFDGLPHESGAAAALLRREPPRIGWRRASDGAMLTSGRTALVSPHVLTQGFDHACARMASLGVKAVRQCAGDEGAGTAAAGGSASAVPGLARLALHAAGETTGRLSARLLGRRAPLPRWNVGWRRIPDRGGILDTAVLGSEPFRWLAMDPSRFVADPFAFAHEGRTYVFVEELPFATWRGFLSVFEIAADGSPSPLRPVLERPYHLSYPSVFRENGVIWMIPETGANRTIELYRADPFPDRWVLERVLIDDIDASDATFFRHGGRCWLAVATSEHGASSWDSLSLFHADTLTGPWRAHARNPVLTDPARARPAGWLHACANGLIRPAQDCVGGYGAALALSRVTRLDPERFEETTIARLAPPPDWQARGLHTVTQAGGFEVIDAVF